MEAVVLRYYRAGMSLQEISNRTSMPKEFIEKPIVILSVPTVIKEEEKKVRKFMALSIWIESFLNLLKSS